MAVWHQERTHRAMHSEEVKKQHRKVLRLSAVRPFVLYSLRHTFLTRFGASGCDAWTLARIAGHFSVGISAPYVHPSEDTVLAAVEGLRGHKIGHSGALTSNAAAGGNLLSAMTAEGCLVGARGFEPPTPCAQGRGNQTTRVNY